MPINPAKLENTRIEKQLEEANINTLDSLIKMVKEIQDITDKQTKEAKEKACTTFRDLRAMIWAAYALGFALIVIAIALFVFQERTLEILGFGTLGAADIIALFLYKPMDRLQKANADFSEQFTILRGWAAAVNLHFLAMESTNADSIKEAAKNIQQVSMDTAKAFQDFCE